LFIFLCRKYAKTHSGEERQMNLYVESVTNLKKKLFDWNLFPLVDILRLLSIWLGEGIHGDPVLVFEF
jgi:hypothetical protein